MASALAFGSLVLAFNIGSPSFRAQPVSFRMASNPIAVETVQKNNIAAAGQRAHLPPPEDFPRTWVPLASTFELMPERPTPVRFLGQQYVVFCDNDGEWRVMDDACPHRLAPLSEGRIDRDTNTLECAYHGWAFEAGSGACARIPQAADAVSAAATASARSCVASYPTRVHKSVLWVWPWEEDCLSVVSDPLAQPEGFLAGVADDASTYTRDLPYGWDTLLENIVDPAHIPFAHHGLQGMRTDAIPINMTNPTAFNAIDASAVSGARAGLRGFEFEFGDRTMGKRRAGTGEFRAPFVVAYNADFEPTLDKKTGELKPSRPFNLTVVCLPTAAGHSRAIIYGSSKPEEKKKKKKGSKGAAEGAAEGAVAKVEEEEAVATKPAMGLKKQPASLVGRIFKLLPVWLIHIGSNRFLDSDLAFLHYQEQAVSVRGGDAAAAYFMPAPADRCIVALRKWLDAHARGMAALGPLPPALYKRDELFDRWTQHTSHCRHCQAALAGLRKWRTNTYRALAVALLAGVRFWQARVVGVLCIGLLRLYALLEKQFMTSDYEHWKNN